MSHDHKWFCAVLHLNLDSHLSKESYLAMINLAIKCGTNYFCTNVKNTYCTECGHISKRTLLACEKCGSEKIDYLTRIIGYLKRIAFWSTARQKEAKQRHYHN
jgi:ribonucleoside-triphosphate reductase